MLLPGCSLILVWREACTLKNWGDPLEYALFFSSSQEGQWGWVEEGGRETRKKLERGAEAEALERTLCYQEKKGGAL